FTPLVALKLGQDGALIRQNGETIAVEAELVENPVDTTGAGDLWQAGFLYGLMQKKSLSLCGQFASAAAAELVQTLGARLTDETLEKLKQKFTDMEKNDE
ncbi:MAG: adenosine kinase, partial [Lentisphaeria bacterium]|nr:adenosine kinase [Lentisphaeria bacterium]